MNEIKIVPYGNLNDPDGLIKELDNYRNTYSRQGGSGTGGKNRIGSRAIQSRGGPPVNPMEPTGPKYSYNEDRPQTRGNQSHVSGTASGGTRNR